MDLLHDGLISLIRFDVGEGGGGSAGEANPPEGEKEGGKKVVDEEAEAILKAEPKEVDVDKLSESELRALVRTMEKSGDNLRTTADKFKDLARERLHEIMEKKAKIKDIEEEKESTRKTEMEEKEQYKKLYEEVKPQSDVLKKDAAETHKYFGEEFEKLREELPVEYHKLIPSGVDVRTQIKWIRDFMEVLPAKEAQVKEEGVKKKSEGEPKKKDVGEGPGPIGKSSKTDTSKATIEEQIKGCNSAKDLEDLLFQYGRKADAD